MGVPLNVYCLNRLSFISLTGGRSLTSCAGSRNEAEIGWASGVDNERKTSRVCDLFLILGLWKTFSSCFSFIARAVDIRSHSYVMRAQILFTSLVPHTQKRRRVGNAN